MSFREDLLRVMDAKNHWAWAHLSGPEATLSQIRAHYEQEYLTYVRDFPLLLGRIHGRCPIAQVRRLLAENIYEEETGGLSGTAPHPELFLRMMEGLGFRPARFERARLLPASRAYRRWLDETTTSRPWIVGAAVMTLFVEGSVNERREISGIDGDARPRTFDPSLDMLVKYHGAPPDALALKQAHAMVEGDHRKAAWDIVERHARGAERIHVVRAMRRSLRLWLAYRDGVAAAVRVVPPARFR